MADYWDRVNRFLMSSLSAEINKQVQTKSNSSLNEAE